MEGWIKLHRQIIENPLYFSEPFTRCQAWIDMLLLANTKDGFFYKRGIRVEVIRGQVGYDIESLAKRWKWSRGKAERFLNVLEIDKQVIRQKSNVTTLISICNYNTYQSSNKPNDNPNTNANEHQTITQTVTQTEANKNNKNNKELKEVNTSVLELYSFESFWNLYNKKVDTSKCKTKFVKLASKDKRRILETLPSYLNSIIDKTYLKNPLTYLNGQCWNDEIIESTIKHPFVNNTTNIANGIANNIERLIAADAANHS